jgi:hypothetical protein
MVMLTQHVQSGQVVAIDQPSGYYNAAHSPISQPALEAFNQTLFGKNLRQPTWKPLPYFIAFGGS